MITVTTTAEGGEAKLSPEELLMLISTELQGRIRGLDGGEAALAFLHDRDVPNALEALRGANKERLRGVKEKLGEEAWEVARNDDTTLEVVAVTRELREHFPYGITHPQRMRRR
jgi:hypothetical protein